MAYLTRSEQIQLPPPSVFACLVDLAEAPRWRPLVERMEVVGGGELKVGAVVRVVYRIAGKTQERSFVVTDYDPPRAGQAAAQLTALKRALESRPPQASSS